MLKKKVYFAITVLYLCSNGKIYTSTSRLTRTFPRALSLLRRTAQQGEPIVRSVTTLPSQSLASTRFSPEENRIFSSISTVPQRNFFWQSFKNSQKLSSARDTLNKYKLLQDVNFGGGSLFNYITQFHTKDISKTYEEISSLRELIETYCQDAPISEIKNTLSDLKVSISKTFGNRNATDPVLRKVLKETLLEKIDAALFNFKLNDIIDGAISESGRLACEEGYMRWVDSGPVQPYTIEQFLKTMMAKLTEEYRREPKIFLVYGEDDRGWYKELKKEKKDIISFLLKELYRNSTASRMDLEKYLNALSYEELEKMRTDFSAIGIHFNDHDSMIKLLVHPTVLNLPKKLA